MPIYEYNCSECGPFTELRRMDECAMPAPCPSCQSDAPRIVSAPRLAIMGRNNRIAWERNEKSAHEPRHAKSHQHDHGHAHEHKHVHKHSHRGRPWMLGH